MLSSNMNNNMNNNMTNNNLTSVSVADIEAQVTNVNNLATQQTNNSECLRCKCKFYDCCNCCSVEANGFCCIWFLIILFVFPFIFCDLYYAYNSISCQHDTTSIGFTLSTWLGVAGFSQLVFILSFGLTIFLITCCESIEFLLILFQWLYCLLSLSWLIVGCVMFWHYLEPTGNCDNDISYYMWARLIIGLVCVCFSKVGNKEK